MALMLTKSEVKCFIEEFVWLLYGPPKIGKSTFGSEMDEPYFLTTEHGHRHLSIYNRPIVDWKDFKLAIKELRHPKAARFKTIVIDTIHLLYLMCQSHVCQVHGLEHPGDEDYGKGYEFVKNEFHEVMIELALLNKGIMFICHHKEKEVKGRGIKYTKFIPKLPAPCWDVLGPLVDVIGYCGFHEEDPKRRVLITEPREDLEAGFRLPLGFESPLPPVLPLSYDEVKKAWSFRHSKKKVSKKSIIKPKKKIIVRKGA